MTRVMSGLVGQLAHEVGAVQHDAGERGGEQVDVDAGSELAAVAGALEDRAGDLRPWGR